MADGVGGEGRPDEHEQGQEGLQPMAGLQSLGDPVAGLQLVLQGGTGTYSSRQRPAGQVKSEFLCLIEYRQ